MKKRQTGCWCSLPAHGAAVGFTRCIVNSTVSSAGVAHASTVVLATTTTDPLLFRRRARPSTGTRFVLIVASSCHCNRDCHWAKEVFKLVSRVNGGTCSTLASLQGSQSRTLCSMECVLAAITRALPPLPRALPAPFGCTALFTARSSTLLEMLSHLEVIQSSVVPVWTVWTILKPCASVDRSISRSCAQHAGWRAQQPQLR